MTAVRIRRPRDERIAEIMRAAREVFAERGYEDTAMAEIASRVGVVEGALYRFFDSKRELLIQVLCHWYEEVMASYETGLAELSGVRERLRFVIWHHLTCIQSSPELLNLFFGLVRMDPQYLNSEVYRLNQKYAGQVIEILRDGIACGMLRPDTPLRMARDLIYGAAEQRTWAYRMGLSDFDPKVVADQITDVILTAYAPKPRRHPSTATAARRVGKVAEQLRVLADELGQGGAAR